VPGYTRHQLKEDKFANAAKETVHWAVAHGRRLQVAGIAAAVVVALAVGGWWFLENRNQQGSDALGKAMRTHLSPVLPPGTPEQPGVQSFASAKERSQAALKEFQEIAENYSFTRSAEVARYMVGVAAVDLGDTATAERELKAIAGSHNKDLAPLAKMALASLYRTQNREVDAVKIYKELIDTPTRTVPKVMAQLELASLYEQKQPDEAAKLYQQIRIENPTSAAADLANARLNSGQR